MAVAGTLSFLTLTGLLRISRAEDYLLFVIDRVPGYPIVFLDLFYKTLEDFFMLEPVVSIDLFFVVILFTLSAYRNFMAKFLDFLSGNYSYF